jgi:AP-3 complex subunit delta
MWERTLQDLIRGLRANKADEAKFISQAVEEIRREIKSKDMDLKAGAVLKLTYVCHYASPCIGLAYSFPIARNAGP